MVSPGVGMVACYKYGYDQQCCSVVLFQFYLYFMLFYSLPVLVLIELWKLKMFSFQLLPTCEKDVLILAKYENIQ